MVWIALGLALTISVALAAATFRRSKALGELSRQVVALGEGRTVRPILTGVSGSTGRLVAVFNDVGLRLSARVAQLERDRELLRAVLSGMAEGVVAVDARRRLLFANASADQIFGLGPASVGRLVPELIRSPQVQKAVDATLAATASEPYRGEITTPGRSVGLWAAPRILSVHGTPLPGSPTPGAVLVFHDVTDLRRLERMRQDFVANASHELKTPVAAIKAYTENLLDWALHDENVNVKFLHRIDEQADRLNQLVLDLLSLARLESGQEVYDHRPLSLAPVIGNCVDSYRDRAVARNLDLRLDLGPVDGQALVIADEEAIRQILDNLIDNALKYTPEGGSVLVSCRLREDAVSIEVADTGIGIPREDLPRVFERFYRVDKARSRELGGTGLGLSIVKHLVQSIGGQVNVESRVGDGSRFTVQLPRHQHPGTRP
jgi:two-component system phosphate regulon sensor histidine kinase PhoR